MRQFSAGFCQGEKYIPLIGKKILGKMAGWPVKGVNKMQEGKLCPLLSVAGKINALCDGNDCAWYDECAGECAVLAQTGALADALAELKYPYKEASA